MRRITTGVILGVLVSLLALPVLATSGGCDTHYNHSGNIPGSYDYAEFYEDGQLVTTVETNGEDVFVDPADYDAGESWDQVNKCHNGETPPPPLASVECVTLTIDAAEGVVYQVQIGDGFVETEGTQTFVGSAGQSWAVYWNDQVIANGVFEECSTTTTEQVTTTTAPSTSSTVPEPSSTTSTTLLTSTTTNPAPPTTVPSEPPELPFTGPAGMVGLLIAGVLTVGIGSVLVREFRSE